MSKEEYYIEKVNHKDTTACSLSTGIISSNQHSSCVVVYGERYELTQRLIRIVNALNEN